MSNITIIAIHIYPKYAGPYCDTVESQEFECLFNIYFVGSYLIICILVIQRVQKQNSQNILVRPRGQKKSFRLLSVYPTCGCHLSTDPCHHLQTSDSIDSETCHLTTTCSAKPIGNTAVVHQCPHRCVSAVVAEAPHKSGTTGGLIFFS